jgi:hypothetical protein
LIAPRRTAAGVGHRMILLCAVAKTAEDEQAIIAVPQNLTD